jgi:hypothetical protein
VEIITNGKKNVRNETSINQIKATVDSIISRQERISDGE